MDISVYTDSTSRYQVVPEEVLVKQGYRYRDIFAQFRRLADTIGSVTLWGLGDDSTWLELPHRAPGPAAALRRGLQAKHAYWGVVDPLRLPVLSQRLSVVNGTVSVGGLKDNAWRTASRNAFGAEDGLSATSRSCGTSITCTCSPS